MKLLAANALLFSIFLSTASADIKLKLCSKANDPKSCTSYNDVAGKDKNLKDETLCRVWVTDEKSRMIDNINHKYGGVQGYELEGEKYCCDFFTDMWCTNRKFRVCGDLANKRYDINKQFGREGYAGSTKAIKCGMKA